MKSIILTSVRQLILPAMLLLGSGLVAAQGFPGMSQPQTPLTADLVQGVYTSYQELINEFQGYSPDSDSAGLAAYLKSNNAHNKAERIVKKHGFQSWVDWNAKFIRVMQVYAAAKMKSTHAEQQPQIERQIQEIRNNPDMSPEQKEYALSILNMSKGLLQGVMMASEQDINVMQPYVEKFDALTEK